MPPTSPHPATALATAALLTALLPAATLAAPPVSKITYDHDLQPFFHDNCFTCHNPDKKKADLDLTSYTTLMAGSSSGPIVTPGDITGSPLYKVLSHTDTPYMPPKKPMVAAADIELVKRWIETGLLENDGAAPLAAVKPTVNLKLTSTKLGKPAGPPPMPVGPMLLEPLVHTTHLNAALALAHSPWAPLAAIASQRQVLLYNSSTLDLLAVLPFPEGFPDTLAFSRSGRLLAVGGGYGAKIGLVALFDVTTGRRVTSIGDEPDQALACDIAPDQASVAIGGPARLVKVYNTADNSLKYKIKKHTDWVTALAFSPDGVLLASGDRNGGLEVWEAQNGENFYELRGHKKAVTALAFRDDANLLASASEDGTVRLWNMQDGSQVKTWTAHAPGTLCVAYSHDGRIVTAGRDNRVKIWTGEGKLLHETPLPDIATRAAFSDDGSRVIAGDFTGHITVISTATGKPLGQLDPDPPTLAHRITIQQQILDHYELKKKQVDADLAARRAAADKTAADLAASKKRLAELPALIRQAQHADAEADAQHHRAASLLNQAQQQLKSACDRNNKLADAEKQARKELAKKPADAAFKQAADRAAAALRRAEPVLAAAHQLESDRVAALHKATADRDAAQKNLAALRAELPSLAPKIKQQESAIADAQKKLAETQAIVDAAAEARRKIAAYRAASLYAHLYDARTQLTAAQLDADRYALGLTQQKAAIARDAAQVENLKKHFAQVAADLKTIRDRLPLLTRLPEQVERDTQSLTAAVAASRQHRDEASTALAKADAQARSAAHAALDAAQKSLAGAVATLADSAAQLDSARAALAAARQSAHHLETELAAAPAKLKQARSLADQATSQFRDIQASLDTANKKLAAQKSRVDHLAGEYAAAQPR